ncbi:hypothetical protein BpHYR1_047950 [Brachionus plicatilis]|uniref:Uncharacterized protein n=1 Tax=Brachionus plicatilis TaxID=10195 RepID=A0A3M7S126_BRAPC|nr:hypothetical protein BpHYR1_047950 [Brachionus plicatilis]
MLVKNKERTRLGSKARYSFFRDKNSMCSNDHNIEKERFLEMRFLAIIFNSMYFLVDACAKNKIDLEEEKIELYQIWSLISFDTNQVGIGLNTRLAKIIPI